MLDMYSKMIYCVLFQLYTDHLFMYPTVQLVRKLIEKKTGDVYLYHFTYSGTGSFKIPNQAATNLKYNGNILHLLC